MNDTLLSLFERQVRLRPRGPALRYRSGGFFRTRSYREWYDRSRQLAAALIELGVNEGDRVAILAKSSVRWVELDLAVLSAGAITVPIYPTVRADTVREILKDSGAKVLLVEDPVQLRRVIEEPGASADLVAAVVLEPVSRLVRPDPSGRLDVSLEDLRADGVTLSTLSFNALVERGAALLPRSTRELDRRRDRVQPSSLAAIYYTSGTSGEPKGVMLTHDNFVFESETLAGVFPIGPDDEQLLFLPLAHIVAKITMMLQLRVGFVTSFSDGIEQAADDCRVVRPTFLVGVPRVFEKVEDSIEAWLRGRGEAEQRAFAWALEVGREVHALSQAGRQPNGLLRIKHASAERLVYSRIRERLGGRIRFMLSGAAPLERRTAEYLSALGLLILEGYGLTESTGASTLNQPGANRIATVGRALPGVQVTLAEDSEVLLSGRSVTRGYWRDPDSSSAAFDDDGAFRTGDLGRFDADGYLTITGRKKDLIITAGGKNIAPQRIERRLASSRYIDRAVVIGDRRKFVAALLRLDVEAVSRWAEENGLSGDYAAVARHPKVHALVASEVERINEGLAQYETVKRFDVIDGDLSVEDGTLTPTGKVRRAKVAERYASAIDSLYEGVTADLADIG
ncbi:MAG: long-chain fatty acid--CoA ligase [Sandaracinaceae bacterium]